MLPPTRGCHLLGLVCCASWSVFLFPSSSPPLPLSPASSPSWTEVQPSTEGESGSPHPARSLLGEPVGAIRETRPTAACHFPRLHLLGPGVRVPKCVIAQGLLQINGDPKSAPGPPAATCPCRPVVATHPGGAGTHSFPNQSPSLKFHHQSLRTLNGQPCFLPTAGPASPPCFSPQDPRGPGRPGQEG